MKTIRILILEDDLQTLSLLLGKLAELESVDNFHDFAVTVLSEYTQVEEYVNKKSGEYFDIILLDRDCKACGSFHVLDFDKFDPDKIISISSVPEYNKLAQRRGTSRVVWKDFENLELFAEKLIAQIVELL